MFSLIFILHNGSKHIRCLICLIAILVIRNHDAVLAIINYISDSRIAIIDSRDDSKAHTLCKHQWETLIFRCKNEYRGTLIIRLRLLETFKLHTFQAISCHLFLDILTFYSITNNRQLPIWEIILQLSPCINNPIYSLLHKIQPTYIYYFFPFYNRENEMCIFSKRNVHFLCFLRFPSSFLMCF